MNDLILFDNQERPVLNIETAQKLSTWEKKLKEIKKAEDEIKATILAEMEAHDIIKLETEELIITRVEEYDRETLDSKRMKQEIPTVYDEYVKLTTVKPSIRIKLR